MDAVPAGGLGDALDGLPEAWMFPFRWQAHGLAQVSRAVKAAAEAARLFGEDVSAALPTIEMIAREDLTVLAEAASAAVTA